MERNSLTQLEVLKRWPRLTAHLICESLGYFTPRSAANALIAAKTNQPFFCEWYSSIADKRGKDLFDEEEVLKITREVVGWAIQNRHRHKGYMAEYKQAREVIARELEGHGPVFASWF